MMRLHLIAILSLVVILAIAIGYPELKSDWFAVFGRHDETARILFFEVRLPRLIMAIVAGSSLAVSGLMLQTLFNNPLAGPSILGLTSGSHLFVAVFIMVSSGLTDFVLNIGITASAGLGAFLFSLIIVAISRILKSGVSLLLTGMILGTFVSAITQLIQSKADPNALKAFTIWSMGSLQQPDSSDLFFILPLVLCLLLISFFLVKPMNAMILGDLQAQSLGVNIIRTRNGIIMAVAALTGIITAFCGPIAFVGLVVPNIVRYLYKTGNHFHLLTGTILLGAIFLLLCEFLVILLEPYFVIQINILTSIVGAPLVIVFILKGMRHA